MFLFERKRLNTDRTQLVCRARVVRDSTGKLV